MQLQFLEVIGTFWIFACMQNTRSKYLNNIVNYQNTYQDLRYESFAWSMINSTSKSNIYESFI